jgi:hypothetical protein
VHTRYWCDKEVIHIGYRCDENVIPYGIVSHAKYRCTFSNLCVRSRLDGLQQQKTCEFLQHFILFQGHIFAARF